MKGTISWYSTERGFGFIIPENGLDAPENKVFFHINGCDSSIKPSDLVSGLEVTYELEQDRFNPRHRPKAIKVRTI